MRTSGCDHNIFVDILKKASIQFFLWTQGSIFFFKTLHCSFRIFSSTSSHTRHSHVSSWLLLSQTAFEILPLSKSVLYWITAVHLNRHNYTHFIKTAEENKCLIYSICNSGKAPDSFSK